MKLALCTCLLWEEHWETRLQLAGGDGLTVDSVTAPWIPGDCDAAVVALDGPAGLAAVRMIRESSSLPLLWIADEPDYALFAYQYGVTEFLLHDATPQRLTDALHHLKEAGP